MKDILNEKEFSDPARRASWMNIAMGWKTPNARHVGGMRDPREVKLRRGSDLFRIGHSTYENRPVSDEFNLSRSWWMENETFCDIGTSANIIGLDKQVMARLKLSVGLDFGVFDTIFWVKLVAPLGAFMGYGNPVYEAPSSDQPDPPPAWAWPGREVRQCFIPGLSDLSGKPTGLAAQAFTVIARRPVSAWAQFDTGVLRGQA